MKPVRNMYIGTQRLALRNGSSVSMISHCTLLNRPKASSPERNGVITQLDTMGTSPPQFTASTDTPTEAKPMMAPTMEWVVDTGQPRIEAMNSQVPADS